MLVDGNGRPLKAAPAPASRSVSVPATHHAAASHASQELAGWLPALVSADRASLWERDTVAARIRDLARNDGWAAGSIRRELDNVVGASFRLSYKPDWRALGQTAEWAQEFSAAVEGLWRLWTMDPGFYCDLQRQLPFPGVLGQAYRHYAVDGDAIAILPWRPGRGTAWATTVQVVHPDRLSNPNGMPAGRLMRGGVELDEDGAAVAFHFRDSHPTDRWADDAGTLIWTRIPRETEWGRPNVVHFFDKDEADQHRGVGRLTAVVERLKMLTTYDRVELQAAVINAIFAAYVESPFDHEMLQEALADDRLSPYQELRAQFHEGRGITVGGARLATLFPGERINTLQPARPAAQFDAFEAAVLRNVAAGIGLSYEQVSADWSRVNYSSARAALLEVWRTLSARRESFARGFATPIFAAWLEETIDAGMVELPPGAPEYWDARAAWTRCRWIGPGRGWVDPTKEAQAAQMRMDAGLSTLEAECAEQGLDWEEVLEQRQIERDRMLALGLPLPPWAANLGRPEPAPREDGSIA